MIRALLLACLFATPLRAAEITVFAAASLGPALEEAADAWAEQSGHRAVVSPAGSSALARQIAQGAPADVILSANPDWIDWLEDRDLIDSATRRVLMSNRLVLIARGAGDDSATPVTADTDIAGDLGDGRLAMALVQAVPAGIYGRQALTTLGQWEALAPRVAQADNVRAALALVALGEAPLGIVYATDAAGEKRVHVAGIFPEGSHDPILNPGAVTANAAEPEAARAFLDWLGGPAGRAILDAHGFGPAR
ncbi:molybdate ABC transporter substrate-binding protein [Roseivivax sediminis]|uniref:Molybdate transport system substrate-binding protein n=1 Tax=Roseivivax sediminis TaxID=936889 RepID=A0A1I2BLJ3_9RHOB|nr:molybdate ABC transporter substrate-binding protein [Roseivivax sediminis]SFE56133.1 molybdate transport system substrate-binding protein [Roseivivax sediminis]